MDTLTRCDGSRLDHCCIIEGRACEFLEVGTVPGRFFACGLLRELGSWDAVARDPRWQVAPVGGWLARHYPGQHCGDFPQNMPSVMNSPTAGKCCWGAD